MSRDYFDSLESELMAAVTRVAASGPAELAQAPNGRRLRVRGRLGLAVPVLAVLVVVAVVLTVIGLHGPGQPAPRAAPGKQSVGGRTNVIAQAHTLAQLRATFGVLDRPQTPIDLAWRPPSVRGESNVSQETRVAGTLLDGERVGLVVRLAPDSPWLRAAVYVIDPAGRSTPVSTTPSSPHPRLRGFRDPWPFAVPGVQGGTIWAGLVPPRVRTVRWTFVCAAHGRRCGSVRQVTFTVPPNDGLATAWVRHSGSCPAPGCLQPVVSAWIGVDGGVTSTAAAGAPVQPQTMSVLRGDGIDGLSFGSSPAVALQRGMRLLGKPSRPWLPGAACGTGGVIGWAGRPLAAPLTLYFQASRLVAYIDGSPAAISRTGGTLRLGTGRLLVVGESLSAARAALGSRFVTSSSHRGTWRAPAIGGEVTGVIQVDPRTGEPAIGTIQAGDPCRVPAR